MPQLVFINIIIDNALLSIEYASLYLLDGKQKGLLFYQAEARIRNSEQANQIFIGEADHFVDSISTDGSRKRKDAKDIADFIDVIRAVTDAIHAFCPSKTSSSRLGVDKIDIECARFEHVESEMAWMDYDS